MKKTGLVVSTIISAVFLVMFIMGIIEDFHVSYIFSGICSLYVIFSFVSCLFYSSFIQDILLFWLTRTIRWPGLIFTFDLDGILWLIGMKLLFAVLGFLAGLLCAVFGIVLAAICAPFAFPFAIKEARCK